MFRHRDSIPREGHSRTSMTRTAVLVDLVPRSPHRKPADIDRGGDATIRRAGNHCGNHCDRDHEVVAPTELEKDRLRGFSAECGYPDFPIDDPDRIRSIGARNRGESQCLGGLVLL
jgi:hypothetical protein